MDKENVVHIYNEILLSHKKECIESVLMRWMKLEPVIQSKVNQKEKNKYHVLMRIYRMVLSAKELMLLNCGVGEDS